MLQKEGTITAERGYLRLMRKYAFRESKTMKVNLMGIIMEATKGNYLQWNMIKREKLTC